MKIKIIGSGLSGSVAARILKDLNHDVIIFETRKHIGGNCYDEKINNVLMHVYGPHIFHTDDEEVFDFLSKYTEWFDFSYRPKGVTKLGIISLPYSKKTIKEIGRELTQEEISNYIFKDYSEKQWGFPFSEIPKSITNRIPKTKNEEDPTWYSNQKYQCLPKNGYTNIFKNMLDGITIYLNCDINDWKKEKSDLTIYTGKIDEYYNYVYGKLPYRSLNFEHSFENIGLDNVVYNYNTKDELYTRKYDHSYFNYIKPKSTIITKETPILHDENNLPFYPIPWGEGLNIYSKYKMLADTEKNVIFLGRLATYTYLDMWMAIKQCMLKIKNNILN